MPISCTGMMIVLTIHSFFLSLHIIKPIHHLDEPSRIPIAVTMRNNYRLRVNIVTVLLLIQNIDTYILLIYSILIYF